MTTTAGLWLAVVLSGLYHGLSPGMGWPLAVSSALMERRQGALFSAMAGLAIGHFAAVLVILLPFVALGTLLRWQSEIQIGAGLLLVTLGLWILITRRHPRFLARVPPHRLALWSFLVAIAHGAGLMIVPIYLGLCGPDELQGGHAAAGVLLGRNAGLALAVAALHMAAMVVAGGAMALAIYHWLGLRFLSRTWFDLEAVWALSLILVGGLGIWFGWAGH